MKANTSPSLQYVITAQVDTMTAYQEKYPYQVLSGFVLLYLLFAGTISTLPIVFFFFWYTVTVVTLDLYKSFPSEMSVKTYHGQNVLVLLRLAWALFDLLLPTLVCCQPAELIWAILSFF